MPVNSSGNIMLALGTYNFSIDSAAYESFRRDTQFKWASSERVGQRPAQQAIGPGIETITLPGVIYTHYLGGLGQLNAMRAEAGKLEPFQLCDGRGFIYGPWCITRVTETQTVFFNDGIPRKIEFSLSLVHYGDS
ncbi:phage tail protein [Gammaproteobacteria bacterium AH-315-C21]|nr:phage tail protein [Gammaproteobacteria bacterium AH-315-C21]